MSELESDLFWRPEALKVVRTQSPRMRQVLEKLKSVAPTRTTVLLLGDTGVGKGMIAKLIHQHSSRSDMPFVHLHCDGPESASLSDLIGEPATYGTVRRNGHREGPLRELLERTFRH